MSHVILFVSANETEANIVYNRCGLTKLPPSGNMRFYILVEKKSKTNIDGNSPQRATNIAVEPTDGNVWTPAHTNSVWKLFRVMLVLFFVFPARFQNIHESKNMDVQKFTDLCLWIFPISSDCTNCILPLTLHLAIFLSHSFVGVRCTCKTWGVHELSIGIGSILWKRRPLPSISAPSWHLLSTQKSSKVNTRKLKSPQTKAQKSHKKTQRSRKKSSFVKSPPKKDSKVRKTAQRSTKKSSKVHEKSAKVHKKKAQKSEKQLKGPQKKFKSLRKKLKSPKRLKSQKTSSKVHKSSKVHQKRLKSQKQAQIKDLKGPQKSSKAHKKVQKSTNVQKSTKAHKQFTQKRF